MSDEYGYDHTHHSQPLRCAAVSWLFTGLLLAASAHLLVLASVLLYRLADPGRWS
ncbi:MAG: hypothetical protein JO100_07340 [Pseudonocardia sp.]|nr:hypothetical protein [Pseudonocardia sp.]